MQRGALPAASRARELAACGHFVYRSVYFEFRPKDFEFFFRSLPTTMADNKDEDKDEAPPQPTTPAAPPPSTTPAAPPQPTTPAGVSQPTTSDDQSGSGSTGVPLCRLCFTRHGVKEKCPVCDNVATRLYQRLLNEFRHDFAPCSQHIALEIGPFNVDA